MASRKLKLRVSRQFSKSRHQVESLGLQAGEQIDRNLVGRLNKLAGVRRFVITWIVLVILLIGTLLAQTRALSNFYQTLQPTPGGVYNEGILGDYTNANPVYATGTVDTAVSRLVFSSLFKYNAQNQLVGDLASSWSVNPEGTVYTIHLKPGLTWQDGTPITSRDVLFTYKVIQSPDAQSPLETGFQNITLGSPDLETVTFTLSNPLSSFPYSLTTGILPEHLLNNVPMGEMRSTTFNTLKPVGSGPFVFNGVEEKGVTPESREETIELTPFSKYWGGEPKLNEFVIHAFHDQTAMVSSFNKDELNAISGLSSVPPDLKQTNGAQIDNFPLTAAVMVFFKTSSGILADAQVRQALVQASDQVGIIGGLGYPTIAVREPLLQGQLGWNPAYNQGAFNPTAAAQILTADGWLPGSNGIRYKNGQQLSFNLTASNSSEYTYVANSLKEQWSAVGVNVQLSLQDDTDLQSSLTDHTYDSILYGISIGVDPDVFVYWDSSQADPRSPNRLNLSEYSSAAADDGLEEGRTRSDPVLRSIKYKTFLQAWQQDAPALGLYQPRFLYVTRGPVFGLNEQTINSGTDRYNNVQNWEIRENRVTN
jgi:peptide/nickel transport system substrate-binding protein